jgi:hypothetical protein
VILYFGGNAEDVLYTAGMARRFEARRLLVTSYRGYGARSGRPSEAALYEDAAAIYDHVVHRQGVAPAEIVVLGRSLGSGVATWLAAHRPVRAAVLVTPFDSLVAVAKGHYPIFPVGSLMRHRFASDERARELELPVLMIAAERDTIIPPAHASALHEVWRGPKSLQLLAGVGHNDLEAHPRYHDLINEFLDSVFRGELAAPSPVPTAWE